MIIFDHPRRTLVLDRTSGEPRRNFVSQRVMRQHGLRARAPRRYRVCTTDSKDCGRDAHYWAPPAQNRTCGIPASGSHLGCLTAKRWLGAVRTRSSPGDTLARLSVRRVLACPVFSLAPSLRSTNSGPGRPRPFAGFPATMEGSDFSSPCITGFGSSPSRCGPGFFWAWPEARSPGSRARSLRTCWGLRPRRAGQARS